MLTTPQADPTTPHRLGTVLGGTVVVGFDGSPPAGRALRHDFEARVLLGSVAAYVAEHAHCDVLVVR